MMEVIHVVWVDSEAFNDWTEIEEAIEPLGETHSVGFVVDRNRDFVLLACSYDPETNSVNAAMKIPQKAIKRIKHLCLIKPTKN